MGKRIKRRSEPTRIEQRRARAMDADHDSLVLLMRLQQEEAERRRYWSRLGCPIGPVST